MRDPVTVSSATPETREAALKLLFSRLPANDRDEQVAEFLDAVTEGRLSLDGLLAAHLGSRIVGTVLYLMQPDQCAYVWPPIVDAPEPAPIADQLLGECTRQITVSGAWIAQCMIEPDAIEDREALLRNGFRHLADLDYLTRSNTEPLPASLKTELETVTFRPLENQARFADVIERTYRGSLDCPGLEGVRSGADAIESHSGTGDFMPEHWTVFCDSNGDVGVLILADHPDQNAWEVVYMGIVPQARGCGYGREILLHGLRQAERSDRASVVLAVDCANRHARRIYDEMGFVSTEIRSVHALLPDANPDTPQIVHTRPKDV